MRSTSLTIIAVILALIFVASGALYLYHRRHWGNVHFVQKVWIAERSREDRSNMMQRMVDDLQKNYLKPGLTKAQVQRLIGGPDSDMVPSKSYDSYFLGSDPSPLFLEVHYDTNGRLSHTKVNEP